MRRTVRIGKVLYRICGVARDYQVNKQHNGRKQYCCGCNSRPVHNNSPYSHGWHGAWTQTGRGDDGLVYTGHSLCIPYRSLPNQTKPSGRRRENQPPPPGRKFAHCLTLTYKGSCVGQIMGPLLATAMVGTTAICAPSMQPT